MAKAKRSSAAAAKPLSSEDLKGVLKRVKASGLSAEDKAALGEILTQSIKLRQLLEKAKVSHGGKGVIASLPFGFDIVK